MRTNDYLVSEVITEIYAYPSTNPQQRALAILPQGAFALKPNPAPVLSAPNILTLTTVQDYLSVAAYLTDGSGKLTPEAQIGSNIVTEYFAQNNGVTLDVYYPTPSEAPSQQNPDYFWQLFTGQTPVIENNWYTYLLPTIASNSSLADQFLTQFDVPNARTYFFIGGDTDGTSVSDGITRPHRCLSRIGGLSSQATNNIPDLEAISESDSSAGSMLGQWVLNNPSALAKSSTMAHRYLAGLTPFQVFRDKQVLAAFDKANWNYPLETPANSPVSAMLERGNFTDGTDMMQRYNEDWMAIQSEVVLTQTLVAGSQPGRNPLVYDPDGIKRLQMAVQSVITEGLGNGVIISGSCSATDFSTYVKQNPGDYQKGIYKGLFLEFTLSIGFKHITLNITADFGGLLAAATVAGGASGSVPLTSQTGTSFITEPKNPEEQHQVGA